MSRSRSLFFKFSPVRTMVFQAILVTTLVFLTTGRFSKSFAMPTGSNRCGDLTIPFPFGTSSNSSLDESFLISCNHSYNPPKPFLNSGSLVVLNISLDGLIKVASPVASDCYDDSGSQVKSAISRLTSSRFPISSKLNKFTAIGCDTYALLQGSTEWKQMAAGCVSWCDKMDRGLNGTCSGIGCCQSSIPEGVRDFSVAIQSFKNHSVVNSFNPCSYAFVVETDSFNFSSSDLKDFQNRKFVPVVLDWSVGYRTCSEARKDLSTFACYANSDCIDSSSGVGYHCKCATGFQGNPYSLDGCQDIDECIDLEVCEGMCKNLPGSYSCSCPAGYEGDGTKGGEGCHSKRKYSGSTFFYIASGLVVPAFGSSWILWRRKKKKVDRLRWEFFLRNGGLSANGRLKIFGAEDLKKATNNYDMENVVSGSVEQYGVVMYRALLPDGSLAVVVKHDTVEECHVEVFIRDLIFRSKLHHRHIAKLLGCCLETRFPLLVFEYLEHESLHDRIHDLSWDIRLRIALGTARTLEYMHHCLAVQMIHGRLTSSRILLNAGGTVKILVIETYPVTSLVDVNDRAIGYVDPHYFITDRLTAKSDVYSFGVILAEILTGQRVFSHDRHRGEEYLVNYFLNSLDNLDSILDGRLDTNGRIDELRQVAALTKSCLSSSPMDRPTMAQVADALKEISISHSQIVRPIGDQEETTQGVVIRRNI